MERCKLPQQGLGQSPSGNRILCIFVLKSGITVSNFSLRITAWYVSDLFSLVPSKWLLGPTWVYNPSGIWIGSVIFWAGIDMELNYVTVILCIRIKNGLSFCCRLSRDVLEKWPLMVVVFGVLSALLTVDVADRFLHVMPSSEALEAALASNSVTPTISSSDATATSLAPIVVNSVTSPSFTPSRKPH